MGGLRRNDVAAALEIVEALGQNRTSDPFPLDTLGRLGALVGADVGTGYSEGSVETPWRCPSCGHSAPANGSCLLDGTSMAPEWYELVTRPTPPWLPDALAVCGTEDPTHMVHCHAVAHPVAISDFVTVRAFARLAVYHEICRPLDIADSLRLYLPSPPGRARFFWFDRSRRGFDPQSRTLLELLRPHLARARGRWWRPLDPPRLALTRRQLEILRWVGRGLSNEEIAQRLWISEHTVRKHLENINDRLGVHSRVAAAVAYLMSEPIPDEASRP